MAAGFPNFLLTRLPPSIVAHRSAHGHITHNAQPPTTAKPRTPDAAYHPRAYPRPLLILGLILISVLTELSELSIIYYMTDQTPNHPPDETTAQPPIEPLVESLAPPLTSTPPLVSIAAVSKRSRLFPMTEDRKNRYIEGLRISASHRYAAMYATPNGEGAADKKQIGYAYSTFYKLRREDLEFAARCDEAHAEAIGRLEASVMERAFKPDVRVQYHPDTGAVIGKSEGWLPANRLAVQILARADDSWVEKKHAVVESNVTVNDRNVGAGAQYIVRLDDVQACLSEDESKALMGLLAKLEDHRQQQESQRHQHQLTDQRGEQQA
jgi:hypothetical protein